MTNPQFPNRPNTDDFWLMAEAVQDLDSAADDGTALPRLIDPIIDIESLTYMAEQRAARSLGASASNPLFRTSDELVKRQALWIDAFVAGALYQKYKTERGK